MPPKYKKKTRSTSKNQALVEDYTEIDDIISSDLEIVDISEDIVLDLEIEPEAESFDLSDDLSSGTDDSLDESAEETEDSSPRGKLGGTIDIYLQEVQHLPLLSAAEERKIAIGVQKNDEDAIKTLIERNLRFVISVAKKYQNRGMDLEDLIQEGNRGLIIAAKKFDLNHKVKFISYAVWWIRQCILSALAENSHVVRVPLNRTSDLTRLLKAVELLSEKMGRDPSDEDVMKATGLTLETVQSLRTLNSPEIRLDSTAGVETDQTMGERLQLESTSPPVEYRTERKCLHEAIDSALSALPDRDAHVLRLYFGLGGNREHTLEEIGNLLKITRERVRQLRDRAVKNLKTGNSVSMLKSFTED